MLAWTAELAAASREAARRELGAWRAKFENQISDLEQRLALTQAVSERACAELRRIQDTELEQELRAAALQANNVALAKVAAAAEVRAAVAERRARAAEDLLLGQKVPHQLPITSDDQLCLFPEMARLADPAVRDATNLGYAPEAEHGSEGTGLLGAVVLRFARSPKKAKCAA
jgi:hypothetical protein